MEKVFTKGHTAGIQRRHKARIEELLQALHTVFAVEDMDLPGWRLHPLQGDKEGQWIVNVSGSWRIILELIDSHAYVVTYEDYH